MFVKSIFRKLTTCHWTIGFVQNDLHSVLANEPLHVRWLKHDYKDRWFADPFILEINENEIVVLVEEFYNPINRGRLAKLTIDKSSISLIKTEPILTLDTHLSFPAIIRKDDKVYIYPENHESGHLYIYEFDVKSNECRRISSICNEPLTDAIYTEKLGRPQIFSTVVPTPNGTVLDIYDYDEQTSTFIKGGEIIFKERIARNAGDWFEFNGRCYRPAQECNVTYGRAISLQEVKQNGGSYQFCEIRRITSPHPDFNLAFHTFNLYSGLIVVDALGYKYKILGRLLRNIRDLFPKPELQ